MYQNPSWITATHAWPAIHARRQQGVTAAALDERAATLFVWLTRLMLANHSQEEF